MQTIINNGLLKRLGLSTATINFKVLTKKPFSKLAKIIDKKNIR